MNDNYSARQTPLTDTEFQLLQKLFYEQTGVQLPPTKRPLICGRLSKRLAATDSPSYLAYYKLIISAQGKDELQTAIDLITTHETYFFREPQHFDFLTQKILPKLGAQQSFRVWSAASSTGEEAYTLAMLLDNHSPKIKWQVVGTDISHGVLKEARKGLYPLERNKIPTHLLKQYCLRGHGQYQGYMLVDKSLRAKVEFTWANLTKSCKELGQFDLVMLRNVLIYFDLPTKQQVLRHVLECLKPGGVLMLGHSESLQDAPQKLELLAPSVYRKP